MKGEEHYELFFETLANGLRVRILQKLLEGESTVGDLSFELDEEQSKVSHALYALRLCKLVRVRVQGTKHYYYANEQFVRALFKLIDDHVCSSCTQCDKLIAKHMKE